MYIVDYLVGMGYSREDVTTRMSVANIYMYSALAQKRQKAELQTSFSSRLLAARGEQKQVKRFQQDISK